MSEKLTTSNWVTLIGGVGAVLVGLMAGKVWAAYEKADLRYEEQPPYRSGDDAIACLKLHNYGWSDAKDIVIAAKFQKPLSKPPVSSDDTYPVQVVSGGKGDESASVSIKRIVPGQTLYVFYAIDSPKEAMHGTAPKFVTGITFEGGKAQTGQPWTWPSLINILFGIVAGAIITDWWGIRGQLAQYITANQAWQDHSKALEAQMAESSQKTLTTLMQALQRLTEMEGQVKALEARAADAEAKAASLEADTDGKPATPAKPKAAGGRAAKKSDPE